LGDTPIKRPFGKFLPDRGKSYPLSRAEINLQLKQLEEEQIQLEAPKITPPLAPPLGRHRGREQRTTPIFRLPLEEQEKNFKATKKRGRSSFLSILKKTRIYQPEIRTDNGRWFGFLYFRGYQRLL